MTPEGKVKARVRAIFKKHKVWYTMPVGTGLGRGGVPDFIACVNGLFLAVETKSTVTHGKLTALQSREIEQIMAAGGVALVVTENDFDELEDMIVRMGERGD